MKVSRKVGRRSRSSVSRRRLRNKSRKNTQKKKPFSNIYKKLHKRRRVHVGGQPKLPSFITSDQHMHFLGTFNFFTIERNPILDVEQQNTYDVYYSSYTGFPADIVLLRHGNSNKYDKVFYMNNNFESGWRIRNRARYPEIVSSDSLPSELITQGYNIEYSYIGKNDSISTDNKEYTFPVNPVNQDSFRKLLKDMQEKMSNM